MLLVAAACSLCRPIEAAAADSLAAAAAACCSSETLACATFPHNQGSQQTPDVILCTYAC